MQMLIRTIGRCCLRSYFDIRAEHIPGLIFMQILSRLLVSDWLCSQAPTGIDVLPTQSTYETISGTSSNQVKLRERVHHMNQDLMPF